MILILITFPSVLFATTIIDTDMNTGYSNTHRIGFEQIYEKIFYPEMHIIEESSKTVVDDFIDFILSSPNYADDYFDYHQEVQNFQLMQEEYNFHFSFIDNEEITTAAHTIPIANYGEDLYFELYINKRFIDSNLMSLVYSSLMREIIYINDVADRINTGVYTPWDEVENTLYKLDAYYGQARYVKHYSINNALPVTHFEYFMLQSYSHDVLYSFFLHIYGIERSILVGGYHYISQLIQQEIDYNQYFQNIEQWFFHSPPYTQNHSMLTDMDSYVEFANDYTYASFYSYFIHNWAFYNLSKKEHLAHHQRMKDRVESIFESNLMTKQAFIDQTRNSQKNPYFLKLITLNEILANEVAES
ncbi:MAG: hypothetical protein MI717_11770 [Spirochaetales bacterium]|nr:hypothetical protein [Spirochaetales bacterium]